MYADARSALGNTPISAETALAGCSERVAAYRDRIRDRIYSRGLSACVRVLVLVSPRMMARLWDKHHERALDPALHSRALSESVERRFSDIPCNGHEGANGGSAGRTGELSGLVTFFWGGGGDRGEGGGPLFLMERTFF
jgi:hypothetical protein